MAKKRRRRRRYGASTANLKKRGEIALWTAAYGYAKEKSTIGPKMLALPHIEAIGFDATMMLVAHYLAKHGPRVARKPCDKLATGLAGLVGYKFGSGGFKLTGIPGMSGAIGGAIDPDDFAVVEDEFGDEVE